MVVDKLWVYYKEQCKYCSNRKGCKYKEKVKKYIDQIESIDNKGIYGTTSFWCDYYILDKEKYWKENPGDCCV